MRVERHLGRGRVPAALLLPLLLVGTRARADSWLNGFAYRQPLTVTDASAATNIQVRIVVNTAALVAAGKMRSDCADLRVTDASGASELPYYLESGCNTAATVVWVRVPSLPANAPVALQIYSGDSTAGSASNFAGVFPNSYILTSSATLSGSHDYDWFQVAAGATLTVSGSLTVTARRILVQGTITGVGQGYPQASGPGAGHTSGANGGGAGYGGTGGCAPWSGAGGCSAGGGSPYGTSSGTDLAEGSGGGNGSDHGGAGGAAVSLAGTAVDFTGTINMAGANGYASGFYSFGGGGGSGGGILLMGSVVSATGSLGSRGGKAGNPFGGCGAGGRVKIFYGATFTGAPSVDVSGETTDTYGGTVYLGAAYGGAGTYYRGAISYSVPAIAFGSADGLVTQAGVPTSWAWKVPAPGQQVKNGSPTGWAWTLWRDDGTALHVPRGTATGWNWGP